MTHNRHEKLTILVSIACYGRLEECLSQNAPDSRQIKLASLAFFLSCARPSVLLKPDTTLTAPKACYGKNNIPARAKIDLGASLASSNGNSIHSEILLGLPRKEYDAVFAHLQFVELRTHDLLNEMGGPIAYCHFVNSGLASALNVTGGGKVLK